MRRSPLLALLAVLSIPCGASAYFDVELEGNRHIFGDEYVARGDKLLIFGPSGEVEVDRAAVRTIQERSGSLAADVERSSTRGENAAAGAPPSIAPPVAAAPAKDPAERDRELAHRLINTRLDRLAAEQRGDDEAQKKLDKQIGTLQAERLENWKKLQTPPGARASAD